MGKKWHDKNEKSGLIYFNQRDDSIITPVHYNFISPLAILQKTNGTKAH